MEYLLLIFFEKNKAVSRLAVLSPPLSTSFFHHKLYYFEKLL
jgi:hypothetical protein